MDSTSNENGTTQESGLIDASTSEVSCSDHGDNTESFKGDDDNTADNGGYDRAAATDADRSRAEAGTASPTPTHFSSPKNNGQTTHKSLVWNENDKTPPPSSVRSRDATAPDTHPQQVSWVSAVRSTEPGEYATTTTGRYQIVSTNKKDLKRVEAGPESLESGVTKREQIKDDVKYKNIEPAKRPGAVAYLHNVPQEPQQDDDKEPRNFMSEPNVSRTTTKTPPSDVALAVTTRTTPPRQSSLRDHRKTPCYTESAKPSGEAVINMKEGYKFINRAPPEPGPPVRSSLKSSESERSGGTTAISSKAPDNITQRRRSSNVTNGACHDKTDWTIRDQAAIVEPSVPSDSSSQHRARASTEQGGAPGTATDFKATNHQGTDGHRASSEKMSLSVSAAAAGIGNAGLLSNTAEKCVNKDGKPSYKQVNATKVELQTNSLEGELPTGLVDMPMLTNLLIEENKLSGTINPDIFNNKTVLRAVWLQDNNFTGPIPSTLANLESLMSLGLNFNNFEGDVPFEICELRSSDGLAFLFADCLGYPPATYCFCCTSCCYRDEDFETCQTTDDAEPDSRRLLTKTKRLESEDHLSKAFYDRLREDVINVIEQNWR